jgi:hypothetical protein
MVAPVSVRFDEDLMWVGLADGRVIGVPLAWFPRLLNADVAVREAFELSPFGVHWGEARPDIGPVDRCQRRPGGAYLDEDISVDGLLAGRGLMGGIWKVA